MEYLLAYAVIGVLFARVADKLQDEDIPSSSWVLIVLFWLPLMLFLAFLYRRGEEDGTDE